MDKKQLIFGFFGLLAASFFVLKDIKKEKTWHEFFVAPPPKGSKLLDKPEPLSVTKETNQRIKGSGRFQSQQSSCPLFENMARNLKQEDEVSKVTTESAQLESKVEPAPVKASEKVSVKAKKVAQKIVSAPKQEKDYFPVSFERKDKEKALLSKNSFILGCLYGNQELKHGRSIIIVVKESFNYQGQEIPKGTFLYGVVAFGKERVLSKLETAVFGKHTLEVAIALYDLDYTLGLLVENLHPFLDNAQDKLLGRAACSSSNTWIKEIGSTAVDALKSMKKEPKITLENRRKVLLKPIEK